MLILFALGPRAILVAQKCPICDSAPDTLTLLGLSGSGANCMVLINDRSFHLNESGKVRYANTNAWVRCVEIRDNSVVIQAEGAPERQELFLKAK